MISHSDLMKMDKKARKILEHYKTILTNHIFDEYDILGFLIFIREKLSDDRYPSIKDFAHLIAHRERNRGHVKACIDRAKENGYITEKNSKKVIGYEGMNYITWVDEWQIFQKEFDFKLDKEAIEELTLCVFSLAQFSEYVDKKGVRIGRIELFVAADRSLALVTTEGNDDSLYVCFSKFGCFELARNVEGGRLNEAVETIRIDGKLRLKDKNGFII